MTYYKKVIFFLVDIPFKKKLDIVKMLKIKIKLVMDKN